MFTFSSVMKVSFHSLCCLEWISGNHVMLIWYSIINGKLLVGNLLVVTYCKMEEPLESETGSFRKIGLCSI